MLFSLIVPTIKRKDYLTHFFSTLANQELKDFEIIVIDQNPAGFLDDIIFDWNSKLSIIHKNVDFKGASRARNYGIQFSKGQYIAFPDDDTAYQPNTLKSVNINFLSNQAIDICITGCKDKNLNYAPNKSYFEDKYKIKSIWDLFKTRAVTSQIFLRKSILASLAPEPFDIYMGPGSATRFGANDDTDFLLKAYKNKSLLFVDKQIIIFHPSHYPDHKKAYIYGLSRFRLIQKHQLGFLFYLVNVFQPFVRLFSKRDFRRIKSYIASFLGRSGLEVKFPGLFH